MVCYLCAELVERERAVNRERAARLDNGVVNVSNGDVLMSGVEDTGGQFATPHSCSLDFALPGVEPFTRINAQGIFSRRAQRGVRVVAA